jgi:branched-chain amino acid transport system substrate-binding protein
MSDDSIHSNDTPNEASVGTRRRQFLTAVGAGSAAATAGCLNVLGGGNETVHIGAVFWTSGVAEVLGAASEASARVGQKAVNEAGGILGNDVEMTFLDHEGDTDRASRNFQQLVQEEDADAIIGLTSSGVTLGTASTVEELGVPFTLTDIGTPYITEHDYDTYGNYYEDEPPAAAGIDNLFRLNANTSINTYAMAKYAVEELDGIERVANMGPDYTYAQQCWDYFKAYADGIGGGFDYVASEFPSIGAGDMTPQINSVLDADPDLVFTSFWGGDVDTFVQQGVEQGLFEQVDDVFDTLGAAPGNFTSLGDTMPQGVHFSSWYWHSAFDNQANSDYLEQFKNEYENDDNVVDIPSFTGASTYSSIWMYKQAMEQAGTTEFGDVIGELEGMTFEKDPRGPVTLDADSHQASAPTVIGEVSDEDDVPYDGPGLDPANTKTYTLDRSTATDLLDGTGLPPGV